MPQHRRPRYKVSSLPLCLVLIALTAMNAAAQTFPITFDATALSAATFNVDFNEIGGTHFPNAVTTLEVPPGIHVFCAPASNPCFNFSVTNSGTLDYDPALDFYVSGRGTSTLTVRGSPITIDATALSATTFNVNFNEVGGTHFPNAVTTFLMLPGVYVFCAPASENAFNFSVTNSGTLDYDPALNFCLLGRGTNLLTVLCNAGSPPSPEEFVADLEAMIGGLPSAAFRDANANLAKTLTNKLNAILSKITAARSETDPALQDQRFQDVLDKLRNDILAKTDGCAALGSPDSNDWIVDCMFQAKVSFEINRIIMAVSALI